MFNLFSSKKSYNAKVNTGALLEVSAGENLLNAALDSGIAWPHNCRVGSCGTCRCRLVDGKIKALADFGYVLDADEMDQGMILACQTRLKTDITVEVSLDEAGQKLSTAKTVNGVITSVTSLTHDIVEILVKLEGQLPPYVAGQYADLRISSIADPRSYSFARAPSLEEPGHVRFYVRRVPGGEMSNYLHDNHTQGAQVSITGPQGSFYLRESTAPALFIAGGSGLAPIKALLEQHASEGFTREVTFLFGARTQQDLYCIDEMQKLRDAYPNFTFLPVLSDEDESSDWAHSRGLVTEYITRQGLTVSACQAYLCGPPPMIDSAIAVLTKEGMPEENIFFDKFLDASHLKDGKR